MDDAGDADFHGFQYPRHQCNPRRPCSIAPKGLLDIKIRRAATEINRRLWSLGDLYSPTEFEMKRVNIIWGKKYEFNAARKIGHGIKVTDKNVKSTNYRKKLIDLINKYKEEC